MENGVIVEMAASTPINTVTAGCIIYFLNAFVIPRNLGYVTVPDGGFVLSHSSRTARQPDAAFISKERLSKLPKEFQRAPCLAVEIVSNDEDAFLKVTEYLYSGSQMVWTVYCEQKTVYVFRLDEHDQLISTPFRIDDTLTGGFYVD